MAVVGRLCRVVWWGPERVENNDRHTLSACFCCVVVMNFGFHPERVCQRGVPLCQYVQCMFNDLVAVPVAKDEWLVWA